MTSNGNPIETSTAVTQQKIREIFFPYANQKTLEHKRRNGRFAYYTSAEVAVRVLKEKQVWMRNATTMNDFSEISYGIECLAKAYKGEAGQTFRAALEAVKPGLLAQVYASFDGWRSRIQIDSYLTCLSEHAEEEDYHGRLSMWRAYGKDAGVALILRGDVFFGSDNIALGAYSSPVLYGDDGNLSERFIEISRLISGNSEFVRSLPDIEVANIVFHMLRYACLCTKHRGFGEEREWRVIASPTMHPQHRLKQEVEIVHGVPQRVLKIDLVDQPDVGISGLSIPALLDRIIIGPCAFPLVVYQALSDLLTGLGIPTTSDNLIYSDIPLRR